MLIRSRSTAMRRLLVAVNNIASNPTRSAYTAATPTITLATLSWTPLRVRNPMMIHRSTSSARWSRVTPSPVRQMFGRLAQVRFASGSRKPSSNPSDWPFWGPPPSVRRTSDADVPAERHTGHRNPPQRKKRDKRTNTPPAKLAKYYNSQIVGAFRNRDKSTRERKVHSLLSTFAQQVRLVGYTERTLTFHVAQSVAVPGYGN